MQRQRQPHTETIAHARPQKKPRRSGAKFLAGVCRLCGDMARGRRNAHSQPRALTRNSPNSSQPSRHEFAAPGAGCARRGRERPTESGEAARPGASTTTWWSIGAQAMASPSYGINVVAVAVAVILAAAIVLLVSDLMPYLADLMNWSDAASPPSSAPGPAPGSPWQDLILASEMVQARISPRSSALTPGDLYAAVVLIAAMLFV